DTDVKLLCGWRGPYLQLPVGGTKLLDGWGNAYTLRQSDGTTLAVAGLPVAYVESAGGPTSPYNAAMTQTIPFLAANSSGTVAGAITDSDPTTPGTETPIKVRLFGPGLGGQAAGVLGYVEAAAVPTSGYSFSFAGLPIGPKVLRAYSADGSRKSNILYIRVPPG